MHGLVAAARPREHARPHPPRVLEPPPDRAPGPRAVELPSTSRPALEGAGFEIVEQQQPSFLLDGSLLVTGEVDRTTEFEHGLPRPRGPPATADWQPDPLILDDQALVANVRGRGLVVLTGCGHSGIVNILRYVQKLTGEDRSTR